MGDFMFWAYKHSRSLLKYEIYIKHYDNND